MRWAFWRSEAQEPQERQEPQRALPDDVGIPTRARPPAAPAPAPPDPDDREAGDSTSRTSRATPGADPGPSREAPLAAPAADLDRTALAAAGDGLARIVRAASTGSPVDLQQADARTLAVAATGALAARLPALSGADGVDELQDELLHAYAELLASRAQDRPHGDREDLLAVAHLAAAAAAIDETVDATVDPALLLLAGVPAVVQLRTAALLLAQTADDGGAALEQLPGEVRALFGPPG